MPVAPAFPVAWLRGSAVQAARRLLGSLLWHRLLTPEGPQVAAGVVVEVEAYAQSDAASHSSRGRTPRNALMFEAPGRAYVYRSYGLHWCINVVCGPPGYGAAVLLRALQPTVGIDLMRARRGGGGALPLLRLARGPGCLTQALGITQACAGLDLLDATSPLRLLQGPRRPSPQEIVATPRIGISQAREKLWRFCWGNGPFISGPRRPPQPTSPPR